MATRATFDIGTDASSGLLPGSGEWLEGDREERPRVLGWFPLLASHSLLFQQQGNPKARPKFHQCKQHRFRCSSQLETGRLRPCPEGPHRADVPHDGPGDTWPGDRAQTDDPSQGTGSVPCSWLLCLITDPATPCPQKWLARSQHCCVCGASCCQRTAPSYRKLSCEVKLQQSTSYVLSVCSHLSPLSLHALNGKLIPLVRSRYCKHHLPLTPETI